MVEDRERKALGHDADDRMHRLVEAQCLPKHLRVAVVLPLPLRVAEDHYRRRARTLVFVEECAAEERETPASASIPRP